MDFFGIGKSLETGLAVFNINEILDVRTIRDRVDHKMRRSKDEC